MVTLPDGRRRPATAWEQYRLHRVVVEPDPERIVMPITQDAQGAVIADFWVLFFSTIGYVIK
jgi:hypothetical protein